MFLSRRLLFVLINLLVATTSAPGILPMAPAKGIANRRQSIAVTSNQNQPITSTKKRRAHSIAPGEHLSPVTKARRSLAPRKSILKASLNFNFAGNEAQPEDETETGDFQTAIHDNTTQRATFARRVSFAEHAHIRLFTKEKNTNVSSSPQSSAPESGPSSKINDENAYPGSSALPRRRSSIRRSVAFSEGGEESMDMDMDETALGPSAFLYAQGDSAAAADMDDEFDEEYDDDDMEMTEAIPHNIIRKRSLSLGLQSRRPLSTVPVRPRDSVNPHGEEQLPSSDPDQSYGDENTTSTSASTDPDQSQLQEYTVPLIKPPAPPTDAWLALRSVTHSGDTPYEAPLSDEEDGEQGMELTDAVQRLMAVRQSFGSAGAGNHEVSEQIQEDSFASTDDSFDEGDEGNHTVNVTGLIRRASMGAASEGNSTMEVTEDYGAGIVNQAGRLSIAPIHRQESSSSEQLSRPTVFNAPIPRSPTKEDQAPSQLRATVPQPFNFSFTPKTLVQPGSSPSKAQPSKIPTPVFSAAPSGRSSPKKRPAPSGENGAIEDLETEDRPSPAKRAAIAAAGMDSPTPVASDVQKHAHGNASKPTSRLSPNKKATFPSESKKSTGSVRRPSGYFAQRKSMGVGAFAPAANNNMMKNSPKKAGRMSIGHGAAAVRFDVAAEKEKVQREKESRERTPPSSPTRQLPAPQIAGPSSPIADQDDNTEMEMINPAAQWREDVQEQSFSEEDSPLISIEQFFNMTGIRFMDEITAPRRSTIHPSALRPRRHSSPSSAADFDIPLAEYVTAMSVDIPQLELYTYVSKDLEAWIERSKVIFKEAEVEAEKITPELFREFIGAGEEGQAELLHQLKLIKVNTHANAKSEWYDWKLQWVEQLYGKADKGFNDLAEDAKALETITQDAQALVPSLREEYEQVIRELEEEKALVAEIESSDQQYLNELKTTISEQNAELEAFRADVAEGNAKLERLQEKLQELDSQKTEATSAIEEAQRLIHVQKNSTGAEVFRLKDELESFEDLHLWRATKINSDLLEFVYASTYRVSIPCVKFTPVLEQFDIKVVDNVKLKLKDAFPQLTDFMLRLAKQRIVRDKSTLNVKRIIQRLSDYWSSCAQIRSQLKLVAVKYPLSIEILQSGNDVGSAFRATASVIFPNFKSKAMVSFILDVETLSSWPVSVGSTTCAVEVVYGPVEHETILNAVVNRLGQATPAYNHACFLDACIEAMDQYA